MNLESTFFRVLAVVVGICVASRAGNSNDSNRESNISRCISLI